MTQNNPVFFLLVDDLEENLLSLEALLRRDGLVILKARSGREALELLLKHEVALAILDIQMPGMDGFELAELMRGTERTRRVPIIFLTAGNADRQRRFRGYEAGAVDFLHKPIEHDILRSKADVFFELYRQQQQIADQRDALKTVADKLKEADTRKDEFLATLAHELRNPLAPIRNGLQILKQDPEAAVAYDIRDMMDRQLTHLVYLIDDLMDVSRISQGKIDLRKNDILLRDVIQSAIETSRPQIDAKRHSLSAPLENTDIWLHGDMTRLTQVVSNLLNNAAKYTPEGGRIALDIRHDGADIVIRVTDNGVGIKADMLGRIFDLFTQVDRNIEQAQGGLGIGLTLARQFVEMHGGTISAASDGQGQGSSFTVRLPARDGAPAPKGEDAPANPVEATAATAAPIKTLVVDDNVDSAKTVGWMLELIGHEPSLAFDGLSAIEMAKQLRPDVILLDIGLPKMDGYEVCRTLRADPAFKDTVLIAQTGWGQAEDRRKAIEAGFDHHLVKPISLDTLTRLLAPDQ